MMNSTISATGPLAEEARGRRLGALGGGATALARFARRKPLAAFGALIVLLLLLLAAFGPALVSTDPNATAPAVRLQPPSAEHPLGTDYLGRDLLARTVYGARVSVAVGFGAVAIGMVMASLIGVVSGYFGGRLDLLLQRLVDIAIAFPFLVLLITVVQVLPKPTGGTPVLFLTIDPAALRGFYVIATLGVLLSFNSSRVIRSAVLALRHHPYIDAARALGATDRRIVLLHVLPNVAPTIIVLSTVYIGAAILIEASISYLGFGLPPTVPSWGLMLSEGRNYITNSLNITIWPGLAIALVVFAFNMLGDGLRDVLDPRLRT
jgi:peptide/nickel transport system permease protein